MKLASVECKSESHDAALELVGELEEEKALIIGGVMLGAVPLCNERNLNIVLDMNNFGLSDY